MRIPGRRVTKNLVLIGTNPGGQGQETEIDYIAPTTPFLAVLPKARGLYPLKDFNQIQLNMGVWALPTDGSYVDVALVKFRGFLIPPGNATYDAGSIATGTARFELFVEQYERDDTVLNKLDPIGALAHITGPAPTLSLNGQNYNVAGLTPGQGGGSFSFPMCEDFIGFLVTSDDDEGAGSYTMSVTLGWA